MAICHKKIDLFELWRSHLLHQHLLESTCTTRNSTNISTYPYHELLFASSFPFPTHFPTPPKFRNTIFVGFTTRLAKAAHVGIGGEGFILGHLITHLDDDIRTRQTLLDDRCWKKRGVWRFCFWTLKKYVKQLFFCVKMVDILQCKTTYFWNLRRNMRNCFLDASKQRSKVFAQIVQTEIGSVQSAKVHHDSGYYMRVYTQKNAVNQNKSWNFRTCRVCLLIDYYTHKHITRYARGQRMTQPCEQTISSCAQPWYSGISYMKKTPLVVRYRTSVNIWNISSFQLTPTIKSTELKDQHDNSRNHLSSSTCRDSYSASNCLMCLLFLTKSLGKLMIYQHGGFFSKKNTAFHAIC